MNPEELRIGNWIEGQKSGVWNPFQLTVSTIKQLVDKEWLRDNRIPDINQYLRSITLTEEWFEKFGFKSFKIKGVTYSFSINTRTGYFEIDYNQNELCFYGYKSRRIVLKYVHTLQNLFYALTEEELKAKT